MRAAQHEAATLQSGVDAADAALERCRGEHADAARALSAASATHGARVASLDEQLASLELELRTQRAEAETARIEQAAALSRTEEAMDEASAVATIQVETLRALEAEAAAGEFILFTVTFCVNPADTLTCSPSYINLK